MCYPKCNTMDLYVLNTLCYYLIYDNTLSVRRNVMMVDYNMCILAIDTIKRKMWQPYRQPPWLTWANIRLPHLWSHTIDGASGDFCVLVAVCRVIACWSITFSCPYMC